MSRAAELVRSALKKRVLALIDACAQGAAHNAMRDALLVDIARYQATYTKPYRQLCLANGVDPQNCTQPSELPALATDTFRFMRVSAFSAKQAKRIFVSSGTTARERSKHAFKDLSLYQAAAQTAARLALFCDVPSMDMVILAASERENPNSSLGFMFARFARWFGDACTNVWRNDRLDLTKLDAVLDQACVTGRPIALLGTSFAFVHACDALSKRYTLPKGSRVLHTGGFKGKSREVDAATLTSMLVSAFGVAESYALCEYGMTELSSQGYQLSLRRATMNARHAKLSRAYWFGGWVRTAVMDPITLRPVKKGEVGVLRIEDAANLDSVALIQTADLARETSEGIELLGRSPSALPRGCSLDASVRLSRRSRRRH